MFGVPRAGLDLIWSSRSSTSLLAALCCVDDQIWRATERQILVFDAKGQPLFDLANKASTPIRSVAVSQSEIFTAHTGGEIMVRGFDGSMLRTFFLKLFGGSRSQAKYGAGEPGLALHEDSVLVLDGLNSRIVVCKKSGEFVRSWGRFLHFTPSGLAVSAEGEVFVSDREANLIWVFDLQGNMLRHIGARHLLRPGVGPIWQSALL